MKYSIALFGGVAATSIIYFMLIKGLKDSSFMTPENKHWIQDNTLLLITVFFVFFTLLMQVLHWLKVNVFKVVVLMGTFALALAFAGNDLVNFIGVPLAGFSSFIDYTANGSGNPDNFLMTSLLYNRAVSTVLIPLVVITCSSIGCDPRGPIILVALSTMSSLVTPMATAVVPMAMNAGGYSAKTCLKVGLIPGVVRGIVGTLIAMTLYPM